MEELLTDSKVKMQKTIESFQSNLSKIRTGRASASLLDQISIDYYGSLTPLSQVAAVNAVSYTHLRAHETLMNLVCRLLLEKSTSVSDITPG